MEIPIPKSHTRAQNRINPAWVTAPYEIEFGFYSVPHHFRRLSRKRARHQSRQLLRKYRVLWNPPLFHFRKRWLKYK